MADKRHSAEVERRTAKRLAALVLSLLRGETTAAEAAPRHGRKVAEVRSGRSGFYSARRTHCARGPKRKTRCASEEVNRLKRKVRELTMDLGILSEAAEQRLRRRDVRRVMATLPGVSTR